MEDVWLLHQGDPFAIMFSSVAYLVACPEHSEGHMKKVTSICPFPSKSHNVNSVK